MFGSASYYPLIRPLFNCFHFVRLIRLRAGERVQPEVLMVLTNNPGIFELDEMKGGLCVA